MQSQSNEIGGQMDFCSQLAIETHIRQNGRWLLVRVFADAVIPP